MNTNVASWCNKRCKQGSDFIEAYWYCVTYCRSQSTKHNYRAFPGQRRNKQKCRKIVQSEQWIPVAAAAPGTWIIYMWHWNVLFPDRRDSVEN